MPLDDPSIDPGATLQLSPFVIKELSGDAREVRLVGRALPYRPFRLSGKQRCEMTWLPGSPEATATILGGSEEPTTINGMWKTKYLGSSAIAGGYPFQVNNAPVETARDAVKLINDIRLKGQLVEVTWMDEVRRGILTSFEYAWETSNDVGWQIEFEWINRGEPTFPAVFVTDASVGQAFSQLKAIQDRFDSIALPTTPVPRGIADTIRGITRSIQSAIDGVEDTVQKFTEQVLGPVQAMRGLISTLKSVESECSLMVEFVNSQVADAFRPMSPPTTATPAETAAFDQALQASRSGLGASYSEQASIELYRAELRAWAREMRSQAIDLRTKYESQTISDVLAAYVARATEDLRTVSQQFYRTPYEWRRIMTFNNLRSSALQPGQRILIPRLNPEDASGAGG